MGAATGPEGMPMADPLLIDGEFPGAVRALKQNLAPLSGAGQRRDAGENAIAAHRLPP
jgi:hypothetical protein